MMTFYNTTISFSGLTFALVVGSRFIHISPVAYFVLIASYLILLFYGSYYIGSNFYLRVLTKGDGIKKEIAFSFDDGPAGEYTRAILEVLDKYRVPAAFFCIGKNIAGSPGLLRELHEGGHLIGNHSFSHSPWFDLFSSGKMLAELRQTDALIQEELGMRPRLFRPPYGVTNPSLASAVRQGQYLVVGWTIRSLDTVIAEEQKLFQKICRSIRPGAIILLHDRGKATLSVLPRVIEYARQEGYLICRLDKMLNLNPYV